MSFLKKFLPLIGITLSLSAFAAEEKSLELIPSTTAFSSGQGEKRTLEDYLCTDVDAANAAESNAFSSQKILRTSEESSSEITISTEQLILNFCQSFSTPSSHVTQLTLGNLGDDSLIFTLQKCHFNQDFFLNWFLQATNLTTLNLRDINLFAMDLNQLLILSPHLLTLKINECNVQENPDFSFNIPGNSTILPKLKNLTVNRSIIQDDGMKLLQPLAPGLKKLTLRNFTISDDALILFIQQLYSVEILNIELCSPACTCTCTPNPTSAVRRILLLLNSILSVNFTPSSLHSEKPLYFHPIFFHLVDLNLKWIRSKYFDPCYLYNLSAIPTLKKLSLSCNDLTDDHLTPLSKLSNLEELILEENSFTVEKVMEFIKSLPSLKVLSIWGSKYEPEGIEDYDFYALFTKEDKKRLSAIRPDLEIRFKKQLKG
jgi:hypothetical protein